MGHSSFQALVTTNRDASMGYIPLWRTMVLQRSDTKVCPISHQYWVFPSISRWNLVLGGGVHIRLGLRVGDKSIRFAGLITTGQLKSLFCFLIPLYSSWFSIVPCVYWCFYMLGPGQTYRDPYIPNCFLGQVLILYTMASSSHSHKLDN